MKGKVCVLIVLAITLLSVSVVSIGFAEPLTQEEQELIRSFMVNVMGWQNVASISEDCPGTYTVLGMIGDSALEAEVGFENGGLWYCQLRSVPPSFPDKTPEELSTIAKNVMKAYGVLFNLASFEEYANMIPSRIEGNTKVEDHILLNVTLTDDVFELEWFHNKLGNYTLDIKDHITRISMTKSGVITWFGFTNWHLATSEVNITREEAIAMAMPIAEEYAQNHGVSIASTEALLMLRNDYYCKRSNDPYALYPTWIINFEFDEIINLTRLTRVYGYNVDIWADNCQIDNDEPLYMPSGGVDDITPSSPYVLPLIAGLLGVAAVLLSVGVYKKP